MKGETLVQRVTLSLFIVTIPSRSAFYIGMYLHLCFERDELCVHIGIMHREVYICVVHIVLSSLVYVMCGLHS